MMSVADAYTITIYMRKGRTTQFSLFALASHAVDLIITAVERHAVRKTWYLTF